MRTHFVIVLVLIFFINYATSEISERNFLGLNSNIGETKREKRQASPQQEDLAGQFFDRVFGIPINTLNSVNELVKSTIPMFRRARDRIQQQYQGWQQNNGNGRPLQNNGLRPKPSGSGRSEDD